MIIAQYYTTIINSGVCADQTHAFSDKLQTRNKLSFLCILFSLIYFFYFLIHQQYIPFAAISFGIVLFIVSLVLNQLRKFTASSLFTLFNTNFCVLFFSIYLGFDSGIHLYLFTSPLIVLTLFDAQKTIFIALSMMSYVLNFIILIIAEKIINLDFMVLNDSQKDFFYLVNFVCCSIILIALTMYFLYNNNRVNQLLLIKNQQLHFQQKELKEENETRKEAEERAILSLSEREILLSETHHRVKNNLAVITALLELQSFYVEDSHTKDILKQSQNRIKSIALLHEKLYENKSLKHVNVALYTQELLHFIKQSLSVKGKHVTIHTQIEPISLEMKQAMPFGLMLNELITNSYKYAFSERQEGNIWLNICSKKDYYLLEYKDDGPGFDYGNSFENKSLGLNLIESFAIQLNGTFEYKPIQNYLIFEFKFPIIDSLKYE